MSDRYIAVRFRERQPDPPLRESRLPEMDPGEVAARCDVCGAWGIVDLTDVSELDGGVRTGDPWLSCHECRDQLVEDDLDVDDRTSRERIAVTVERGSIAVRGPGGETEVVDARDAEPVRYVTPGDTITTEDEGVSLSIGGESR